MTQAMAFAAWKQLIMHRANRSNGPHWYQLQAVANWQELYDASFTSKHAYNHACEILAKRRIYPPTHP